VVSAADSDRVSCETHSRNLGAVTVQHDLSRPQPLIEAYVLAGLAGLDLLAGGPPCQPFSRAGRPKIRSLERDSGRSQDRRPTLWKAFIRFVEALQPGAVLLENVPDLVLWDDGQTLRNISGSLEALGYSVDVRVLRCWEYGVPQHRQRLFVVGTGPDHVFAWPKPKPQSPTLWDAIGDLPRVLSGHRRYEIRHTRAPFTALQRTLRGHSTRVTDHITRAVREDDLKAFRLMKGGRSYAQLPRELRRYRTDSFDDKYTIVGRTDLSRSITAHIAKDGYWYIHPDGERMLSIREAARIQTFPDRFRFAGHPIHRLRQIGNAVPPEVARRIGRAIRGAMMKPRGKRTRFDATTFKQRMASWHRGNGREYPWRGVQDPWLVLATEILLRRTRADAVAQLWPRFAKRFPTPRSLLKREKEFRELVQPLGLRWRVDNLAEVAGILCRDWAGRVPADRSELMQLPGVGDYVADAVLAFAHRRRAVLVDSNTARIASRMFGLPDKWTSLRNLTLRAAIHRLGGSTPPSPRVNYALLDLGGTICRPRNPRCGQCPVADMCIRASTFSSQPELV
jgi:DNA (cytosine-5)-methyltransferase 1